MGAGRRARRHRGAAASRGGCRGGLQDGGGRLVESPLRCSASALPRADAMHPSADAFRHRDATEDASRQTTAKAAAVLLLIERRAPSPVKKKIYKKFLIK